QPCAGGPDCRRRHRERVAGRRRDAKSTSRSRRFSRSGAPRSWSPGGPATGSSMTTTALPAARAATRAAVVPWYVAAAVIAATSAKVGVIWDISWHRSIGRDTFWTPAHMAIYLGGVLAGTACGWLALRTTFAASGAERDAGVRFWGFRAPLGAWVCIWGALAMITSGPFDNWWHNAYGLDVKVLSPPHVILALGLWAIQLGALFLVLSVQNRAPEALRPYGVLAASMLATLLPNV